MTNSTGGPGHRRRWVGLLVGAAAACSLTTGAGWAEPAAAVTDAAVTAVTAVTAPAAVTTAAVPAPAAATPSCTDAPHLSATFVSSGVEPVVHWSEWNWTQELRELKRACISTVILTHTATNTAGSGTITPLYGPQASTDVPHNLVRAAEDVGGIGVYLGLQTEDGWSSRLTDAWAAGAARRSAKLAQHLLTEIGDSPVLRGWFLSPEPAPSTLRSSRRQAIFASYVAQATERLSRVLPSGRVMLAPTFDTWLPIRTFAAMMRALAGTGVDILALQDRTGEGYQRIDPKTDLVRWFRAARDAVDTADAGAALWSDTEAYRTSDWTPATTRALVQAIQAEAPYVSRLATFSFVHYMSRYGWFPAYAAPYLRYASTGALPAYRPSAPEILVQRDGLDVRLGWSPSVDQPTPGYLPAISHYRVYRSADGGAPRLLATVRASRTDPGCGAGAAYCLDDPQLSPGHTYAYTVVAANAVGNTARSTREVRTPTLTGADDLALGAPYTVAPAPAANYPDQDGNLVDGQVGRADDQDPAWAGWTDPSVTLRVDLGSVQPITSVGSSWLQQLGPGVVLPANVAVRVSRDGRSWTALGTARRPQVSTADQVRSLTVPAADSVRARYIRLTATNPGGWLFASEITVRGPHPLAGRTGDVVSRPPSPSYPGTTGGLADGVLGRAGDPHDPQWAGWWRAGGLSITVPLADTRTVRAVTLHCLSLPGWGIRLPSGARVEVSADGIDYRRVRTGFSTDSGTVRLALDEPARVRYVRVHLSAAPDTWTMLSEVSVR